LGAEFALELANVLYCFTFPEVWTKSAQSALRTAIVQAGYVQENDENDCLRLMPESLATVIFCTKTGLLTLNPRDVVLIINSSSTFSDSISYQVEDPKSYKFVQYTTPVENSFG
jgi:hypothetical protein